MRKEFHPVVLKEIAFYLTLLKIPDELSLNILIQLFRAYQVDKALVKTIYFTHRQYTQAILQDKIDTALKKGNNHEFVQKLKGVSKVFYLVSEFLVDDSSYFELLILDKKIRQDLKVQVYGNYLMSNPKLDDTIRTKIHSIMVPDKYYVRNLPKIE